MGEERAESNLKFQLEKAKEKADKIHNAYVTHSIAEKERLNLKIEALEKQIIHYERKNKK